MKAAPKVIADLPLKVSELFRPKSVADSEVMFFKDDFNFNISVESEQRIIDLREQFKARKKLNEDRRKKAAGNFRILKVINEYKALRGSSAAIDIPVPESEVEKEELIKNLELEMQQLKEEKERRDKQDEEDRIQAQQLAEQYNKPAPMVESVIMGPKIPSNADPNVIGFIKTIKEVYQRNLEYDLATILWSDAKGDMSAAISSYDMQFIISVTFVQGTVSFKERLNATMKGDELVLFLFQRVPPAPGKEMVLRLNSKSGPALNPSMIRDRSLSEIGLRHGVTVYIDMV